MDNLQEPDEARPAKRVRLEAPLEITEELQEEIVDDGDWDDIYGPPDDAAQASKDAEGKLIIPKHEQMALVENGNAAVHEFEEAQGVNGAGHDEANTMLADDGVPSEAIDGGDQLVAEEQHQQIGTDAIADQIVEETTQVEAGLPHQDEASAPGASNINQEHELEQETVLNTSASLAQPILKPKEDAEFLEAAAAQKDDQQAEWQFDSSDAESSDSDSDSDSSDSDNSSEGGYEMLDPATAAKILMSGDGDDDEGDAGKGKSNGDRQPRTANETQDEVVPKPDVVVTEDMKITFLGWIDRIVDNQVLVKAATPGEYQVLEYGSVLCTEKREVVGAVADTMGRVQEPLYSVLFNNTQEIEDSGLESGSKIFYVDGHSTFVFTQPLKNLKGTDASNIHDEEVGEDEIEFSDDEKEAEYKRLKKVAKKEGRGMLSRGAFNEAKASGDVFDAPAGVDRGPRRFGDRNDAPEQSYGSGMNYDDVDVQDEFYSPLKRPDNLSQLMANGGPPRPQHSNFERGRGRGRGDRGRGRGNRGRGGGGGGFEHRHQRGGRGGGGFQHNDRGGSTQQNSHRGNAHSFPDRHNDYASNGHRQTSQPARSSPPQPSPSQHQSYPAYHQQQQHHPAPQYQQHHTQQYAPQQPPPSPSSYQFNGYTFQYGNPPPQQPPTYHSSPTANSPGTAMPAGSFVHPSFYSNQAQWQPPQHQQPPPPPPQQPHYAAWQHQAPPTPYAAAAYQTPAQQRAANDNLAEILRQLGGQQQR